MGVLHAIADKLPSSGPFSSTPVVYLTTFGIFFAAAIILNVAKQLLWRSLGIGRDKPPVVFHWVPIIGSTIEYGMEPYKFFERCRKQYGDTFTFILLGKPTTVVLGTNGNDFILNSKWKDVSAEEIYSPLCTPVFGSDVVYDCPNAKLMEQKKFVKFGLTTSSLSSYVQLISREVEQFIATSSFFDNKKSGQFDVVQAMAELTIYTASRSLQGKEVRARFDAGFADLYHDLDMGFTPINFMLSWAPLPQNRKRDAAHNKMTQVYTDIIQERRRAIAEGKEGKAAGDREEDMIWNLMRCQYKDGKPVPDHEVAHMMIALLMAGQHSSSSTSSWILLRLAHRPDIQEELLEEQKRVLGVNEKTGEINPLSYAQMSELELNNKVVKETLRMHAPIHSVLRKVKNPLQIPGTPYVVPTSHTLLAAPGVSSNDSMHFPEPGLWEPHRWDAGSKLSSSSQSAYDDEEARGGGKEDYGFGEISKGGKSPYLPFGAGRHRCIGEQFAYVQLGTVIGMLVRNFKLRAEGPMVETDYTSLFSRPLQPATLKFERR